jgi:5-methylcytosine-specific restriction endonuclease McrA
MPPPWFDEQLSVFQRAVQYASEGDANGARIELTKIRNQELRTWYIEHGQQSGLFRSRQIGMNLPEFTGARDPVASPERFAKQVFARDGFRCRYCGLRLVTKQVLSAFSNVVGRDHFCPTGGNQQRHGIVLAFRANIDHVIPWTRGGRTDLDNLVAVCWCCNYGKSSYTLEQIGVTDPRARIPNSDGWDGLSNYLPRLRAAAAASPLKYLPLKACRKLGTESFHIGPENLPFDLLSFWQWNSSDLVCNALRGQLAEFLVAKALGNADGIRVEWNPYDLHTRDGRMIEVKSAAFLQSWGQRDHSAIRFDIAPTRYWNSGTNEFDAEARRQADIYVFALLHHKDKTTLDAMDLAQWEFYVLSTTVLNEHAMKQKHLSLAALLRFRPAHCSFRDLCQTIEGIAGEPPNQQTQFSIG